jgi:protein TonB
VRLDARVPLALGASLLLHGAALALADRLPAGWARSAPEWDQGGVSVLHARLRLREEEQPLPQTIPPATRGRTTQRLEGSRHAAPAAPGILPAPVYVPVEQLDERPQIRSHVEPAFPLDANAASGRVVLRLLIGESGAVDQAVVVDAEPRGPFEVAAVEAFSPARFSPGRKDGVAVKSALTLELKFGEAPTADTGLRKQDVPLFQPPRRAPSRRNASAQEKP